MKQSTSFAQVATNLLNVLQGYTKGIRFVAVLTMLLIVGIKSAWGETYTKVTSAPSDWSGEYLIVYETGKVAFNGALTTLDAAKNTISVTISGGTITTTDANASFTIAKSGSNYIIKSASGYYIGQTSNANGLKSNTSPTYSHTISLNNDGTVNLVSGGAYLRYNAASDQLRFRYYKSSSYAGQKAICLYKLKEETTYSVTYDYNYDKTNDLPVDNNEYTAGSNVTLLPKDATAHKENCYFAGWATNKEGTGELYQAGDTYIINKSTTFYAKWVECTDDNQLNVEIRGNETHEITISWNEVEGANSYMVYLFGESKLGDEKDYTFITSNLSEVINTDNVEVGEYMFEVTPYKDRAIVGCGNGDVITLTDIPTYSVSIATNIQNGTITADKSDAAEGEIVTLTATPITGYAFGSWTVTDASSNTITVTSNTFTMPASNVTVSATFEALPTYSIQWLVNSEKAKGTPTTSVIEGQQISNLPTTPTSADCDGVKEFVGWTDEEMIGISATAPTNLYIELEDFPAITEEKIFYAVFANVEGAGSGNYEKLTADLSDWSGEYLIVYEDESVAFNGGLTSLDVASNYISVEIEDNAIERNETTMNACLFVTAVDGGYAIQSASGYFIGHPKNVNSNKLYYNIESIYVNTFEDYNTIKGESTYEIAYNADAGQKRFRYYNSATVKDVALYKKSSYTNYTTSCVTYTVTWKNYDGTIIETDENVWYGTIPTYNGVLPTKPATDQYNYIFAGWTPKVTSVTGDATYTATFSENVNTYTITFQNYDGAELQTSSVEYGITPTYDGATPTKAADAQYTYTFDGWTPDIVEATEDATYTATYTATVNKYTITWKNGDGTTLKTEEVEYGTTPSYTGTTPTKAATAQYTFTFKGWKPDVTSVTGNATYTATFTETLRTYTITWKNDDGTTLETDENVPYGTTPSYDGEEPTKTATAQHSYDFNGWNPTITTVTGDATYTAKYTPIVNIIWMVNGKQQEGLTTTSAGNSVQPPTVNPIPCGAVLAGWTDAENGVYVDGTSTLYAGEKPYIKVTENKTFYAVFADYEN